MQFRVPFIEPKSDKSPQPLVRNHSFAYHYRHGLFPILVETRTNEEVRVSYIPVACEYVHIGIEVPSSDLQLSSRCLGRRLKKILLHAELRMFLHQFLPSDRK